MARSRYNSTILSLRSGWRISLCCLTCPGVSSPYMGPGGVGSPSRVWLCAAPWGVARQASLSLGFPRQEYWSGLPFPSPGDLPNPGIKLTPRQILYPWATREAQVIHLVNTYWINTHINFNFKKYIIVCKEWESTLKNHWIHGSSISLCVVSIHRYEKQNSCHMEGMFKKCTNIAETLS